MDISLIQTIQRHSSTLLPIPTASPPRLQAIHNISAVLFDIYGTLFISASGEVGTTDIAAEEMSIQLAMQAIGIEIPADGIDLHQRMQTIIKQSHVVQHAEGYRYPEVDICNIWQTLLEQANLSSPLAQHQLQQLAVEYEVRANPVWPMPGCKEVLQTLHSADIVLGIISNAQFYTPLLFPALLSCPMTKCGVADELQFYSFQAGRAKPGLTLYNLAVDALKKNNITPSEVLYVGNDMLNDILPAATVGFRTALFAGDTRSLRLRVHDERIAGIEPDIVITQLDQLTGCIL